MLGITNKRKKTPGKEINPNEIYHLKIHYATPYGQTDGIKCSEKIDRHIPIVTKKTFIAIFSCMAYFSNDSGL